MGLGSEVTRELRKRVPGFSLAESLGKAIFGQRSHYDFNPWHPPGEFRGPEARREWEKKRAAMGLPAYTTAEGAAFKKYQAEGGSVKNYTPGYLAKSSTVMPGGGNVENPGQVGIYPVLVDRAGYPTGGAGGGGRYRKASRKRVSQAREPGARKRRAKRRRNNMTALQRKYFGKRKRGGKKRRK